MAENAKGSAREPGDGGDDALAEISALMARPLMFCLLTMLHPDVAVAYQFVRAMTRLSDPVLQERLGELIEAGYVRLGTETWGKETYTALWLTEYGYHMCDRYWQWREDCYQREIAQLPRWQQWLVRFRQRPYRPQRRV